MILNFNERFYKLEIIVQWGKWSKHDILIETYQQFTISIIMECCWYGNPTKLTDRLVVNKNLCVNIWLEWGPEV